MEDFVKNYGEKPETKSSFDREASDGGGMYPTHRAVKHGLAGLGLAALVLWTTLGCPAVTTGPAVTDDNSVTVWKVLWAISPEVYAWFDNRDGAVHNKLSADQIEYIKQRGPWFEEFVENAANGRLDIQITYAVMKHPVEIRAEKKEEVICGYSLPEEDWMELRPDLNFDSTINFMDYTDLPINYAGIAMGWDRSAFIVGSGNWQVNPDDEYMKRYVTNVIVHEWCHLIEYYYPTLGCPMPILHQDVGHYQYTEANTGLGGEVRLSKWYHDYIGGTIKRYPGALFDLRGVHSDWWKLAPITFILPAGYEVSFEGLPDVDDFRNLPFVEVDPQNMPVITVKWAGAVGAEWINVYFDGASLDDNKRVQFKTEKFFSKDRKTLTLNFQEDLLDTEQRESFHFLKGVTDLMKANPGKKFCIASGNFSFVDGGLAKKFSPNFEIRLIPRQSAPDSKASAGTPSEYRGFALD